MINWKENADKIIAISATVTAVVALVVAALQVRNEQEFQKLSVEPYLELGNTGNPRINYYAFLLINNGLGPAVIKSSEISIDGNPVSDWLEAITLVNSLDTNDPDLEVQFNYSDINIDRRIRAEEVIEIVRIAPYSEVAQRFHNSMTPERVKYRICYCSIYDDCWVTEYGFQSTHQPVQMCEVE